ncbi:MAG: TolC family protein [Bacteroidia bacterium]
MARSANQKTGKALPQLSVFGGIGTRNRFSSDPWWTATNPFIPQQYLNIELSIPIWSWGINQLQVQQSSWSVMARQMAFEQTQQAEAQRINQLINAYNRVRPKLDILLKLEKIREVQYQLTLKKWTLGQSSVQEFYEATQQWKHSEQEYFALLREAWETYLSLQSVLLLDPVTLASLPVSEE